MNSEEKNDVDKDTEVFICCECSDKFEDKVEIKESDTGKIYCTGCYDDMFFQCNECSEESESDDSVDYYDGTMCRSCYENDFWRCDNCDEIIRNGEDCENDSCQEYSENLPERDYDTGNKYCVQNQRAYSCEIECYYPSMSVMRDVADEIPCEIGIVSDGSLDDYGVEFNTPKLSGMRGKKMLKEFTDTLLENDFKVNSTCGLHIHLDGADIMRTRYAVQKLMIFFMIYEDVIMSFLPLSRRDNRYCLPLTEFYHLHEIKNASALESLEKIWYREQSKDSIEHRKKNRHDESRYAGINFHSLLANGHLEIRYHSGTINFEKIINWIRLNVLIMDKVVASCKENRSSESKLHLTTLLKTKFQLGLPEKTKTFFDMLDLPSEQREYFMKRQKRFAGDAVEE